MTRLQHHPAIQTALAFAVAAYVLLVSRFTWWTLVNCGEMQRRAESREPFIACFWHGRMMMMPSFWRFRMPLYILGSRNRDGSLIRRVVAHFGVHSIAGSTSRGGAQAIREMARAIKSGASVGISPDGPRGPRMRAASGIVAIAKLTGARVVPMTYSVSRGRVLSTWDRFLLAFPFGRGAFICGEPVEIPSDADDAALEAARLTLETRLNAITADADRLCGRPPDRAPDDCGPAGRDPDRVGLDA